MGRYDDIIGLSRPVSLRHPPMSNAERAKQFMPFAALRGYDEAISQREVIYIPRPELREEQRDLLDRQLLELGAALGRGERLAVALVCFVPREDQDGEEIVLGRRQAFSGVARKMDFEAGLLRLEDQAVPLGDILSLRIK